MGHYDFFFSRSVSRLMFALAHSAVSPKLCAKGVNHVIWDCFSLWDVEIVYTEHLTSFDALNVSNNSAALEVADHFHKVLNIKITCRIYLDVD